MALHYLSGYPNSIIEGPLVIEFDGRYWFSGATLKGDRFAPNLIGWDIYIAMGVDRGIGVSPGNVALFVDGQAKIQARHDMGWTATYRYPPPEDPVRKFWHFYSLDGNDAASIWSVIITQFSNASAFDKNAAEIRSAMIDWMKKAEQLLQQLISKTGGLNQQKGRIEIVVSDTHWLLHDRAENKLVVGSLEDVWGETYIPKGQGLIWLATPVKNGWFIETPRGNRCLLLWNGNSIDLQDVCFPYGKWTRQSNWTFWPDARVLLTPTGRMLAAPSYTEVLGASLHWFFFYAYPNLVIVDQEGQIYKEKITERISETPRLFIGDNNVFVVCRRKEYYYFSVANASDWPFRRRLWESAALPQGTIYQVGVIRGNPDTFVVIFKAPSKNALGIWFIDGLGRIGRNPLFVKWDTFWPVFDLKDMGNGRAIIRLNWLEKLTEIEVKAINDQVQINMGHGVVFVSEMVLFPAEGKKTLLEILSDAYSLYDS